jgi:integrase
MDDAELRAFFARQQAQLDALMAARPPAPPAAVLVLLYKTHARKRRRRSGWHSRRAMLLPFVHRYRGRDAATLSQADWAAYRDARSDLSPASRNVTLRYLKAMLREGVRDGVLAADPPICKVAEEKQKEHRETAPEEWQIGLLLAACEKQRERVIVLCYCDCGGMRRNETRLLEWDWIDRRRMEITIPNHAAKNRKGGVVPMTRRALAAIDAMPHVLRSPYVLANPRTGKPYVAQMLTNWMRELGKRAGIQAAPGDVRFRGHDLRAAWATNASERGLRLETISDIMRHWSLDQTKIYTRRRPRDLERARQRFEDGIKNDGG